MQITRYTPRSNTPPYNRIFDSYGDILSKLFEERADINPLSTYVEMPGPQQELVDFALSGNQDVGLLIGDIGIGKSSVLNYLKEKVWPTQSCLPLHRDFSTSSENINLPEDFYDLPPESQRQRALKLANAKVVQMVKAKINHWLLRDIRSNPASFFSFLETWCPEDIPDEALLESDKPLEMLKLMQRRSKRRFFIAGFHYYLHSNDIRHIKFVVDNLDDKESLLTHSIIELAAHLARGVRAFNSKERARHASAPDRWMTVIAACRPNTAEIIQHGTSRGGNRWHGFHEIVINKPCSLGIAIKKRYEDTVKGKSFSSASERTLRFSLGQKAWAIADRDAFFQGICDAFDSSGQASQILALCNNNVAAAMSAVLDVIRNRHFVKDEDLLAAVLPTSHAGLDHFARDAFTRTTVLRSLAYGNQGDAKPVYPIDHSPVVNLLHSQFLPLGKSTFKPHVIGMFVHKTTDTSRYSSPVSLEDICNFGVHYFGLSYETAQSAVDELAEHGVIGNSRIVAKPSRVGPDCLLTLRPRGHLLWRLLGEDSILLQCYRDDSELDTTLEWNGRLARFQNRPTQEMPIEAVAHELVWMIRQIWTQEREDIDALARQSRYGEFVSLTGGETVAERALYGLDSSRKRFYQRFSQVDNQILQRDLAELADLISSTKTQWQQSIAEEDSHE